MSVGRPGNESQPLIEPERAMVASADLLGEQPPTGEPNARNWPVRFGGRGDANRRPYPIIAAGKESVPLFLFGNRVDRDGVLTLQRGKESVPLFLFETG